MIDIVDRLRVWSKGMEQQGAVVLSTAITEAADTIARLTAERDEARREAEELRKETWDHGGAFGQYERDGK